MLMQRPMTELERLSPHAGRPIRAFLRDDYSEAHTAFWDMIYSRNRRVTHNTAVRAAAELANSPRTVGEVLNGWRPQALRGES